MVIAIGDLFLNGDRDRDRGLKFDQDRDRDRDFRDRGHALVILNHFCKLHCMFFSAYFFIT